MTPCDAKRRRRRPDVESGPRQASAADAGRPRIDSQRR